MRLTRLTSNGHKGVVFLDLESIESMVRSDGENMATIIRTKSGNVLMVEEIPDVLRDLLAGAPP